MINCIIIEDEPLALKKLTEFINQVDYLKLLCGFDNAIEAVTFLKTNTVDLIFLDIRMKRLTGIQFLESLCTTPRVIITTAYSEYALKGYELEVSDYLLKPFPFERFLKSVEKVYNELKNQHLKKSTDYIFVKSGHKIEKIELNEILYIQGMKDYLQICMTNKKIMTLQSFKKMMSVLPNNEFARVHNSFIISFSKIESIERNRVKIKDQLIPISESFKDDFYKLLQKKSI